MYIRKYFLNQLTNSSCKRFLIKFRCIQTTCSGINAWDADLSEAIKHKIESHWRSKLDSNKLASNLDHESNQQKFYVLSMFPYPSGRLHMGHVRVYTISDTMARFYRMNGKEVIHPIGWDAFGLPAENAAIERGIAPEAWTKQNISHMREQLKQLGCSFDWDREVTTCDPAYYRWTQFIFLKMYEKGLVYRKEALVNWDPIDQTVLADEQVDSNGRSWRSGAKVEKKLLNQWFIRTTRFSKSLLDGLDDTTLQDWRDITKLQKNWIGECNGTSFEFKLKFPSNSNLLKSNNLALTVWTQHPEMVQFASFIAVAPGSALHDTETIDQFPIGNTLCRKLSIQAYNPLTQESLPIFVTDQVNFDSASDCHLGIPKISEEDRVFAEAASIPIPSTPEEDINVLSYADDVQKTREQICQAARQQGIGGYPTSSRLRDWLISRQRYWGTPIPIVFCNSCGGPQPVPYDQLPVALPAVNKLSSKGRSALLDADDWLLAKCPTCGGDATRETDTMDTFVDSSWYFLRYLDPHNSESPFSEESAKLMPVDLYIGGKEHAVLHLYFARFINHFLHSCGMVPHREPFQRLLVQGMVMGKSYRIKGTGKYVAKENVDFSQPKKLIEKDTKEPIVSAWEKMSKSKYNGVDPEDMLKEYGTDTTRLLILADVAPTSHRNWSTDTFPGILKWQHRLWLTLRNFLEVRSKLDPDAASKTPNTPEFQAEEAKLHDSRNFYLKGVTFNYSSTYQLSVGVSKMQGLTNSLRRAGPQTVAQGQHFERALALQLIVLAPMAPHFASELWSGFLSAPHRINTMSNEIKWDRGVLEQAWPEVDLDYCLDLVCKVNGCEHCCIKLPRFELDTLNHDDALEKALLQTEIQQYTSGHKIVDTSFKLYRSYEATINIFTERNRIKQQQVQAAK